MTPLIDAIDRRIVNVLQRDLPLVERPFAQSAASLGLTEEALIGRIGSLLERGVATRFGPLYNVERMGGAFTLAAMSVPPESFERVTALLRDMPEVAHNYAREHALNMWFVLATETREEIASAIGSIERAVGLRVLEFRKLAEYGVHLTLDAEKTA